MKEPSKVPVEIQTPAGADTSVRTFVVSLASAVKPQTFTKIRTAERKYRQATRRWNKEVELIRRDPSNAVLRWKLGHNMAIFFKAMEDELGVLVTNKRQALLRDLSVSKSDLGYTLRMPQRFKMEEVSRSGLRWSQFRELLDINDRDTMKRCMQLLIAGKVHTAEHIRSFSRKARAKQL